MRHLIIYALESSVCLALFMAFYMLFLQRDTRHSRNRMFLLLSLLTSLVFPLLSIDLTFGASSVINSMREVKLPEIDIFSSGSDMSIITLANILQLFYLSGLALALASFLISLSGLILLMLTKSSNGRVIKLDRSKPSCFSAFGFIFISASVTDKDAERMIAHELNHIRKNHFIDLVIVTLVGILQWFNPAVYILRKSLQALHEYEADEECINNGEEVFSYQSLLISSAFNTNIPILTNKFSNKSLLKKRIIMMTKKKTGSLSSIKMLLVLPLAALMFFTFSCNKGADKAEKTSAKEEIYTVVEKMPAFPGGDDALIKFLSENIKYPEPAKEKGIQGKVIVKFCVTKEGEIEQVNVARGVDPSLDAEAVRVINALPKFEPGTQNGKTVNVWYTVPINFALK
jgi:TonB family protein